MMMMIDDDGAHTYFLLSATQYTRAVEFFSLQQSPGTSQNLSSCLIAVNSEAIKISI